MDSEICKKNGELVLGIRCDCAVGSNLGVEHSIDNTCQGCTFEQELCASPPVLRTSCQKLSKRNQSPVTGDEHKKIKPSFCVGYKKVMSTEWYADKHGPWFD